MKIAIAPMLDWTTRHYRYFMRKISKKSILYTEMIVADAILHSNKLDQLLAYNEEEHPIVIQLGGSDPVKLAKASKIVEQYEYDEINLNLGCPSSRVQSGKFGACLMQEPLLVADCIKAMQDSVSTRITIKQRIGLNYNYDFSYLVDFTGNLANIGCKHFIIHARNAVLTLSPKQNREIPPLMYDYVYRLKKLFPQLFITINGGISHIDQINHHLAYVDGVMIGREAYNNPYSLINYDKYYYYHHERTLSPREIAIAMVDYLERNLSINIKPYTITKHMLGLFHGCKNAKIWRKTLSNPNLTLNDYLELLSRL